MSETLKGLRADLYKGPNGDCSNGGLSSKASRVTLVGPEFPEIFEASDEAPAVRFVRRFIGGKVAHYFEPVDQPEGVCGPMASGVYVGNTDSRISEVTGVYGATPLHDRFETWAQYESLSR